MFRSFGIGLAALISGLMFAAGSPAATTHAIIVGVTQTADPGIQPRVNAEADAQALHDLLMKPEYRGVPAENMHLFLGKEDVARKAQPATKEKILAGVKEVVAKAAKDDLVIIAFFGRGAISADRTCFFTSDSTVKDRAQNALATADLEQEFQAFKGDKLVAFIDVNYKGIDPGKEKLLEPNPLDFIRVFVGSEDKEEHTLPQGRVVYIANANISPAVEVEGHGLFAHALLAGLKGAADVEGYEPDGLVTVDEMDTYLDKTLPELARKYGKTNDEKIIAPFDWGGKLNHFAITENPAVMPKVKARLAKLRETTLPDEQKAEGERLLSKMTHLKADQELRKLYQKLADGDVTVATFQSARDDNFAGRKLPAEDAQTFAKKTMDGILIVKSGYVKDVELGDLTASAIKGMYKKLEEKMPAEVKEKLENVKELKRQGAEALLADVRSRLGKREDLEGNKDVDTALGMMMLTLDYPYTIYIDEEAKKKSEIDFRGRFIGIGIQIRRDLVRDGLLVVSPIKGSPAYKAGLKAGDLITEIVTDMDAKGKPLGHTEAVSTKGMKTEDAIKRILGRPNTPITVKVEREGVAQPFTVEIKRNQVNVETVLGARRNADDSWDFMLDPKEKIGYIRLTQFTDKSSGDMEAAVKALAAQGVRGVVLDLRFNPGGLLDAAVEITDLFIDDGKIVGIKPRSGREREFGGQHEGSYLGFPLVCLVNGESASGSEIVSAALQDHKRAIIIGERSFGKGSVQTIHQFRPADAEIKMTTATFWRPNGKNLNKPSTSGSPNEDWGVRPDEGFELKLERPEKITLIERMRDQEIIPNRDLPAKEKTEFKDRQLEMGLEYLKSQIRTAVKPGLKKAG
ncbi:MAG: S41 family peptidase [Gemmataceae bacterium]|nr:S41 family peptidase [Gemmataceae bacterium]